MSGIVNRNDDRFLMMAKDHILRIILVNLAREFPISYPCGNLFSDLGLISPEWVQAPEEDGKLFGDIRMRKSRRFLDLSSDLLDIIAILIVERAQKIRIEDPDRLSSKSQLCVLVRILDLAGDLDVTRSILLPTSVSPCCPMDPAE